MLRRQRVFSPYYMRSIRPKTTDVTRSVVCPCVDYRGMPMQKRLNRLRGRLTYLGPRNHVLDGGYDRTNPFAAARGDKSAMRPFPKLLWAIVLRTTHLQSICLSRYLLKVARC